ncbi:HNH endonuclease family protein [Shewanella algae]|uniref:HNH endonuclease family protein n=1 Tax=Shewanella algae TaxID=38313 RepID=UPI0031F546E6
MDINLEKITVRDLVEKYSDNDEGGVVGYNGLLNIRPPYQREFVYNDKQREAVINTITRGFPLNTMYWAVTADGYEIIDGQQRTVSICQYVDGVYSYNERYFHNLQQDEKDAILDYELTVYQCRGTDSEKLEWFRTINIAGEKLTEQELRNAVYAGSWTADAKRYFSKTQCAAYQLADKYMMGSPIRQDYLETAISWISDGKIEKYMATHQHDKNSNPLWLYFQAVISWVKATFPTYRKEMKGIDWGSLYNAHKDDVLDSNALGEEVAKLMADDEVTKKKGIYEFLLTKNEKYLSIRTFTDSQKRTLYERQNGFCSSCSEHFEISKMEADHITPWSQGGKTELTNGQMLCRECNRRKSNK